MRTLKQRDVREYRKHREKILIKIRRRCYVIANRVQPACLGILKQGNADQIPERGCEVRNKNDFNEQCKKLCECQNFRMHEKPIHLFRNKVMIRVDAKQKRERKQIREGHAQRSHRNHVDRQLRLQVMQENLLPSMHDVSSMEELRVRFHKDIQEKYHWEYHMQSIWIQLALGSTTTAAALCIQSNPFAKTVRVRLIEDECQRKNVHQIRPE